MAETSEVRKLVKELKADIPNLAHVTPSTIREIAHWILEDRHPLKYKKHRAKARLVKGIGSNGKPGAVLERPLRKKS